jgi:galactokinase
MRRGDAAALGELMNQSHASLRDDFAVSTPALDSITACARAQAGCFGARMTGAGFGGCGVALVDAARAGAVAAAVAREYGAQTENQPATYRWTYLCHASSGAALWPAPPAAEQPLQG